MEYLITERNVYRSQYTGAAAYCNNILIILAPTRLDIKWVEKR